MQESVKNKFDILLRAAVYDCQTDDASLLDNIDISSVHFSNSYMRRKKKILYQQKEKQAFNHKKVIRFRIIIAALIAVSIILGSILSISAVRESLWKTILEWYEKYIDVHFESEVSEVSPPATIEEVRKPTDASKDYEEVILYNDLSGVYIEYYKDNQFIFTFRQEIMQGGDLWINAENIKVYNIKINGHEAKLSQSNDESGNRKIIWNDGEYYYMISGNILSVEQMIKIAESVR